MNVRIIVVLLSIVAISGHSLARNVDLSTVPDRAAVQLTIYNSEDLTLVRETRKVTFKKGINPLQFSWANTLIDPTSVDLKFVTHADSLDVLDTTFPQDKPQQLYWNVQSSIDGEATIEISYFTSGITWSSDYLCTATADESHASLEGFVRVTNNSGEPYENAQVRLVVGQINLVEKIAQLAQIPVESVAALPPGAMHAFRARAMDLSLAGAEAAAALPASQPESPKAVVKEGLSEYFIYTIQGTETILNGWSKRLRSVEAVDVPMKIQYRYRPQEYGDQLARLYLFTNDKASKLGTTPLPNGTVRMFRQNGHDGLSYLTSQTTKYIPIGDQIELNLGADPQVIFELIKLKVYRDDLWMQINGMDLYTRVDAPTAKLETNSALAGWNDHVLYTQRIRNYSSKVVEVEVRRQLTGDIVFRSSLNPVLHDFQTVQFQTSVDPGKKTDLLFEVVEHHGHNAKQNNVTLETAQVKP